MRQSGWVLAFVLLLLVPLSCFALWFDVAAVYDVVRQFRSADYPSVPGTITDSQVHTFQGSKGGPRTWFTVRYVYEVGGQKLEGTGIRYVSMSTDRYSPVALSRQFRVKSQVPVFYRSEDPADSLLLPGGSGADLLSPMYPGLFTLMALIGWGIAAVRARDPLLIHEFERQGRIHITVPALPPAFIGGLFAGIPLLIGTSWWFTSGGLSIPTAVLMWVGVFVVGGAAALVRLARLRTGVFDLILDEQALSLPATHGRRRRTEVSLNHIVTVSLDRRGQKKKSYRPSLEIVAPRSGSRLEPIGPWLTDQDRAQTLADALKVRLRIAERRAKAGTPASAASS